MNRTTILAVMMAACLLAVPIASGAAAAQIAAGAVAAQTADSTDLIPYFSFRPRSR